VVYVEKDPVCSCEADEVSNDVFVDGSLCPSGSINNNDLNKNGPRRADDDDDDEDHKKSSLNIILCERRSANTDRLEEEVIMVVNPRVLGTLADKEITRSHIAC
jgi:hypothetical protein